MVIPSMRSKETVVVKDVSVDQRLLDLHIEDRALLIRVAEEAFLGRMRATEHHAPSAAGTFSFHEGLRALRDMLVNEEWRSGVIEQVNYVINDSLGVRIGFWNVDTCCNENHLPEKISVPGANTEKALGNNRQSDMDYGPEFQRIVAISRDTELKMSDWATWQFMVGVDGTAELTYISGNAVLERIFILESEDFEGPESSKIVDDDSEDDLDFEISLIK